MSNFPPPFPAVLHVVRGDARSQLLVASVENGIDVAVEGEATGSFKAIDITGGNEGALDESALRRAIAGMTPLGQ